MGLFDKKFVHFMWSNELAGKKCFVSHFIDDLENMVNSKDKSYLDTVVFSEDKANPFRATTGKYSFAYYDPNYECKLAYRKGKQIQYRVGDTWLDCVPDWNEDYEYRVKPEKRCMSNRELAITMWRHIKSEIRKDPLISHSDISEMKRQFCREHELEWTENCFLCAHYASCSECTLLKSTFGYFENGHVKVCLDYCLATNQRGAVPEILDKHGNIKLKLRIKACDNIIQAIREVKE